MLIRCSTSSSSSTPADNTIAISPNPTKTTANKNISIGKRRLVQVSKTKIPKIIKNKPQEQPHAQSNKVFYMRAMYRNGDLLGRRDLGKPVVKWISQGMKAMASDFTTSETQGEFSKVQQKMGHIDAIA